MKNGKLDSETTGSRPRTRHSNSFCKQLFVPMLLSPHFFLFRPEASCKSFLCGNCNTGPGYQTKSPPMMPRRTRCREEPILLSPLQTSRHPKLTPGATLGDPREDSALSHYWFRLMVLMHTQTHSTGCTRTSPSPWPIHHVQCTQTVRQETDGFQVRHLQIEITSR